MALLNGLYIFVEKEQLKRGVTSVNHPVEKGIELTDHVKRHAKVIELEGKIVGATAAGVIAAINLMQENGILCAYVGRNFASDFQILNFDTDHPRTVTGGANFTMELKEVRIASSPYKAGKNTAAKAVTATKAVTKAGTQVKKALSTVEKVFHTVKAGETAYSIARAYASSGATVSKVMKDNESAPKVKGDWTTLQVGAKLLVAER